MLCVHVNCVLPLFCVGWTIGGFVVAGCPLCKDWMLSVVTSSSVKFCLSVCALCQCLCIYTGKIQVMYFLNTLLGKLAYPYKLSHL